MDIHDDIELLVPKKDVDKAFIIGVWVGMLAAII
jgi:hypothetical protein